MCPRRRQGERAAYLVPGPRAVRELLGAAPGRVRTVVVARGPDAEAWRQALDEAGVRSEFVTRDALDQRYRGLRSGGIVAEADPPPQVPLDQLLADAQLLVALDGVTDPQNLGAIIRTAEFFGAGGVLWPKDRAAGLSPAVVRASAGATERLPLCPVTNLARALETAQRAGFWTVGTAPDGTMAPADVVDPSRPARFLVVLGGEARGMRRLTRARCDHVVAIGRVGHVGSLNVAAAAAVVLAAVAGAPGPNPSPNPSPNPNPNPDPGPGPDSDLDSKPDQPVPSD